MKEIEKFVNTRYRVLRYLIENKDKENVNDKNKQIPSYKKGNKQMAVIHVTKENFEEIKNGAKPVLLDFYADWCGPCRMVAPIIEEIGNERDDIVVGKINVDEQEELAQQFGVMSIPTLVVLKNGEITNQVTGSRPKAAILALL